MLLLRQKNAILIEYSTQEEADITKQTLDNLYLFDEQIRIYYSSQHRYIYVKDNI